MKAKDLDGANHLYVILACVGFLCSSEVDKARFKRRSSHAPMHVK